MRKINTMECQQTANTVSVSGSSARQVRRARELAGTGRALSELRSIYAVFLLCVLAPIVAPAQTLTTLLTFNVQNGAFPNGPLVQGPDGNLYGTTSNGGNHACSLGCGTVFKISPQGRFGTLHQFVGTDGSDPMTGLTLDTNGNFYGSTATTGGFFEITAGGTLTTFSNEGRSLAPLLQDLLSGNFYGTFASNVSTSTYGAVWEWTPGNSQNTIYTFCQILPGCGDGANPMGALVQGPDLFFYGTTSAGGNALQCNSGLFPGCGVVYKIGPGGKLHVIYKFSPAEGSRPEAALVLGTDGNFYGTTEYGGTYGSGTVFKITPGGTETTLYSFCSQTNCPDGDGPTTALVQGTDGNFYGVTSFGGAHGSGTIFSMTPGGTFTTLYNVCSQPNCTDGIKPSALVQATDGNFYGVMRGGYSNTTGLQGNTVFKLSMGLGPFVKTVPTGAYPGRGVSILGTDLTGTTSVTFNGTAATFVVVSPTEIKAAVPQGATTGPVQVTTPSGTLSSNVAFRVF